MKNLHKLKIQGGPGKELVALDGIELRNVTDIQIDMTAGEPAKAVVEFFIDPDIDIECLSELEAHPNIQQRKDGTYFRDIGDGLTIDYK